MPRRRILYICHNHPSVFPGGVETYTLELYEAVRASDDFDPILLARVGTASPAGYYSHAGTPFRPIGHDPNQYFFETSGFDAFYLTIHDKDVYSRYFHEFLTAHRPDVVHFQHAVHMGYDLILQTRNSLPHVPIVMTLQEYVPICHNSGQMVRTHGNELCSEASPQRCHRCFPEVSPQAFYKRQRFLQSFLSLVDLFLAPSRFLLERYVQWGIPREKIRYEDYGRLGVTAAGEEGGRSVRNRFGFFGQFNPFKGLDVLLEAMPLVARGTSGAEVAGSSPASTNGDPADPGSIHLWIHGANLELHPEEFQRQFRSLLESTRGNVTLVGSFDRTELPGLMANIDWVIVPSTWWENSPLVIQEAFLFGRPVICSNIGSMAEKVAHGVSGLHFRRGDPVSLAETIRKAAFSPGLWDKLRAGIPQVRRMEDHVAFLADLYREALSRKPRGG